MGEAGPGCQRAAAAGSPGAESAGRQRGTADWSGMEDPSAPGAGSPPTNGNGNGGGKGKPAAPKGREAFRSQRRESEVRSPEGFQLGPGDTRGGKRWLRCFGRVPLRRPEPPTRPEPLLKAGTCGANRSLNSWLCSP